MPHRRIGTWRRRDRYRPVGYREHPVPPRWRGLAECVWTSTAPAAPEVIDVLPDGCMDLVWSGAELFVAGPDTAPHPFERRAGVAASGLRFLPGVLPALLDVPAATLRDARVPLDACTPHSPGAGAAALAAGAPAGDGPHRRRRPAPRCSCPNPGCARPRRGWRGAARPRKPRTTSAGRTRTLHRRCLTAFGYGPSVLRRVLRFRRAVALLRAGEAPADVAARAGYADQPHLSRDVRAFAGVSPTRLARVTPRVGLRGLACGGVRRPEPACDGARRVRQGRCSGRGPDRSAGRCARREAARTGRCPCRPGRGRSRTASPRTRRTVPARRGVRAARELLVGGVDRGGIGQREGQAHPAHPYPASTRDGSSRSSPRCRTRAAAHRQTDVDVRLRVGPAGMSRPSSR